MSTQVGIEEAIREYRARVAVMRELGGTRWGDIELGPEPQPAAPSVTQPIESREDRELRMRIERRNLALAASARLVPRLGDDR